MPEPSRAEQRSGGTSGGQTVAATSATPFYRWRTAAAVVTRIRTWLSHGCPPQASVTACGGDERPAAARLTRVGRQVWMGRVLALPARLWLGGGISPRRDLVLEPGRSLGPVVTRHGDPDGRHRAAARHLPQCSGRTDAPGARQRPPQGGSDGGDVAGRLWRSLLLAAAEPPVDSASRRAVDVAGALYYAYRRTRRSHRLWSTTTSRAQLSHLLGVRANGGISRSLDTMIPRQLMGSNEYRLRRQLPQWLED
jgi:hypothetical protein